MSGEEHKSFLLLSPRKGVSSSHSYMDLTRVCSRSTPLTHGLQKWIKELWTSCRSALGVVSSKTMPCFMKMYKGKTGLGIKGQDFESMLTTFKLSKTSFLIYP